MAANDPRALMQTLELLSSQLDRSEIRSRDTVQTAENMQRHMDEVASQIERLAYSFAEQAQEDTRLARQSRMQSDDALRQVAHIVTQVEQTFGLAKVTHQKASDKLVACRKRLAAAIQDRDHLKGVVKRAKEKVLKVRDMVTVADQKLKTAVRELRACEDGRKANARGDCSGPRAVYQKAQLTFAEVKKLHRLATDDLARAEAKLDEAERKVEAAQHSVSSAQEAVTLAETATLASKHGLTIALKADDEGRESGLCCEVLENNARLETQHAERLIQISRDATNKAMEGADCTARALEQQSNAADISRLGREDLRQRIEQLDAVNRTTGDLA